MKIKARTDKYEAKLLDHHPNHHEYDYDPGKPLFPPVFPKETEGAPGPGLYYPHLHAIPHLHLVLEAHVWA